MGTSTSSAGARFGVSFDPPWLNDAESAINPNYASTPVSATSVPPVSTENNGIAGDEGNSIQSQSLSTESVQTFAPKGRYKEARRALTRFINTGSRSDMRQGLSSFVKKGMGGTANAARRLRVGAFAAATLAGFFTVVRQGTDPTINDWIASVKARGLSAQDVALEVVKKIIPVGGTIDEESAKHAMSQAVIYLFDEHPDADISKLSDEQIDDLTVYTITVNIFNHVQLEVGRVFETLKHSPKIVQKRLADIHDYIKVTVRQKMKEIRTSRKLTTMLDVATSTIDETLFVFASDEDTLHQ